MSANIDPSFPKNEQKTLRNQQIRETLQEPDWFYYHNYHISIKVKILETNPVVHIVGKIPTVSVVMVDSDQRLSQAPLNI